MTPNEKPKVVDLSQYKQAARTRAAKAAAAKRKAAGAARSAAAGKEPFLGGRPRAGLILVLFAAAFLALWVAPLLMRG